MWQVPYLSVLCGRLSNSSVACVKMTTLSILHGRLSNLLIVLGRLSNRLLMALARESENSEDGALRLQVNQAADRLKAVIAPFVENSKTMAINMADQVSCYNRTLAINKADQVSCHSIVKLMSVDIAGS
jgi:hypothetical protein